MENLDIEKFNPLKKEVIDLVEQCKATVVSIKDDKSLVGYNLMKENKTLLQKKRTSLVETLKNERSFAKQYQDKVIAFEKSLLKILAPLEDELGDKIKAIDEEEEKKKRMKLLPERKQRLLNIEMIVHDDYILSMNDKQFDEYFNEQNTEYLEKKQRKLDEAALKIEQDKKALELKEQTAKDLKKATTNAVKIERQNADIKKQKEIKATQDIKDAEKLEEEKAKKNQEYKDFLARNGYTPETKDDFYIQRGRDDDANTFTLYKKIGSITIE